MKSYSDHVLLTFLYAWMIQSTGEDTCKPRSGLLFTPTQNFDSAKQQVASMKKTDASARASADSGLESGCRFRHGKSERSVNADRHFCMPKTDCQPCILARLSTNTLACQFHRAQTMWQPADDFVVDDVDAPFLWFIISPKKLFVLNHSIYSSALYFWPSLNRLHARGAEKQADYLRRADVDSWSNACTAGPHVQGFEVSKEKRKKKKSKDLRP